MAAGAALPILASCAMRGRSNGSFEASTGDKSPITLAALEKEQPIKSTVQLSTHLQTNDGSPLNPRQIGLLILGMAMAWGGVACGSFQYDDFANVLNDSATTDLAALSERLSGGIRPLTRLSYAVCAQLFGKWAGGWLLVQWLVHLLTVLGIARLTHLRTGNATAALFAAACFAFLPSHATIIAYVSGRSTGFATALLIGALLSHESAHRSGRVRLYNSFAILLFALACAAKEIAIIFPALVLLWEATRSPKISIRECVLRTVPYVICAVSAAILWWTCVLRYRHLLEFSLALRSPLQSLTRNLAALPATLSLGFRPWALSIEHIAPAGATLMAIGATTLCLMLFVAVRLRARQPLVTLALLWPIIALLPTHSVIAKLDAVTEGPLYLAFVGPAIAFGSYAANWSRHSRFTTLIRPVMAATLFGVIGLCMWRTYVWSDSVRLWQEAVVHAPASSRAWTNLGMAHFAANHYLPAQQALRTALELDPANTRVMLNLEVTAALNINPVE